MQIERKKPSQRQTSQGEPKHKCIEVVGSRVNHRTANHSNSQTSLEFVFGLRRHGSILCGLIRQHRRNLLDVRVNDRKWTIQRSRGTLRSVDDVGDVRNIPGPHAR